MRGLRRVLSAAGVAVALLVPASCSPPVPTADADVFEGLDPATVAEVIDDPVAWGKVLDEDDPTRTSMAQGIVRNFLQCRGAYEAYRTWVVDGTTPDVPEPSRPTRPIEPAQAAIARSQTFIEDAIASGDPAQLRDFLVGEARCGEWIPVTAGDRDGPTIAEAVRDLVPDESARG